MAALDASAVARLLQEYGQRTALLGGSPYRACAYGRAADSLLALPELLGDVVRQDRLRDIPGVGEAIADIVTTMHRTGTHPKLEQMREDVPQGVLEMLTL